MRVGPSAARHAHESMLDIYAHSIPLTALLDIKPSVTGAFSWAR